MSEKLHTSLTSEETGSNPGVQELDLSTDEMTQRFAEAPIFTKTAQVHIREATPGEQLTTTLADGTVETVNTAKEGDMVITNPGGEQYFVSAEKVAARYEPTDEEGVFKAKGMVRALQNPTGTPIEIMAPWGEPQYGDERAMLATLYDPAQPEVIGTDRYIIGYDEFQTTYAPVEEASN